MHAKLSLLASLSWVLLCQSLCFNQYLASRCPSNVSSFSPISLPFSCWITAAASSSALQLRCYLPMISWCWIEVCLSNPFGYSFHTSGFCKRFPFDCLCPQIFELIVDLVWIIWGKIRSWWFGELISLYVQSENFFTWDFCLFLCVRYGLWCKAGELLGVTSFASESNSRLFRN